MDWNDAIVGTSAVAALVCLLYLAHRFMLWLTGGDDTPSECEIDPSLWDKR
jgi:hypothetical protein